MRTIELLGQRQQREGEVPCALFVLVRGSEVYRVESGQSRFDEVHIDPARVRGAGGSLLARRSRARAGRGTSRRCRAEHAGH